MLIESPTNGRPTVPGSGHPLSLSKWLKTLRFHRDSPKGLRSAAAGGDEIRAAKELRRILRERSPRSESRRRTLAAEIRVLSVGSEISGFNLPDGEAVDKRALRSGVTQWLNPQIPRSPNVADWRDWAWLLMLCNRELTSAQILSAWRQLSDDAERLFPDGDSEPLEGGLLRHLDLETTLLRGLLFQDLKPGNKQLRRATQAFRQALDDSTDTDGTPQSRVLEQLPGILATLNRVTLAAKWSDVDLWNKGAVKRIGKLLDRTASLVTPQAVSWTQATPADWTSLATNLIRTLNLKDRSWIGQLSILRKISGKAKSGQTQGLPAPSFQSDWAEWGSLRSDWSPRADVCRLRYDGAVPRLELSAAGIPLLTGEWAHSLRVNGVSIAADGDWSCVCWYDDEQAALMELEQSAGEGVRVIRQAVLLRKESLLLLADSIRTEHCDRLEFSRALTIAPGWECLKDAATRELALVRKGSRVRVIPLSSPQDRVVGSDERTEFENGTLTTSSQTAGPHLYSATVLDWHPERRKSDVEWSHLTVAEDGRAMPPSLARGFRLRIGNRQWLLYHSLTKPKIPRTVLGQHTPNETILSELRPGGEFQSLVEVEL